MCLLVKDPRNMDLYSSSLAAWAIWDSANDHLLTIYGFSVIELVKHNHWEKIRGWAQHIVIEFITESTYDHIKPE